MRVYIEKLVQVANYVLKKEHFKSNYTKLIKLLYLADRESLVRTGETITGNTFYALENGPILSELYELIKGVSSDSQSQNLWNARFIRNGYDLISTGKDDIPTDELSVLDEKILDDIYAKYGMLTFGQLIELVHQKEFCPEWVDPNGSSKIIKMETILRGQGLEEDQIKAIIEEQTITSLELQRLECEAPGFLATR